MTDACKESWENQSKTKINFEAFEHEPYFFKATQDQRAMMKKTNQPTQMKIKAYQRK